MSQEQDAVAPPESIDWVARWRRQVEARHDQGRRFDREHHRTDAWAHRARRFASHVAESGADDPLLGRLQLLVDETTTVLDVGSGPGRHTIPLARITRSVVAIEPSAAMRDVLIEAVDVAGLTNVTVVASSWPSDNLPSADVVLCSHVVYPIADIAPFLTALNAAAAQSCYVQMRIGQRESWFAPLFADIWGESRVPTPNALDCFNVAHQLGLPANFDFVRFEDWRRFESFDQAVEQVWNDVLNPPHDDARDKIRAFLTDQLRPISDGRLGVPGARNPGAGIVWWTKTR